MITLGLNAAFHDSSAALVRDGVVLAAVEEERFTRVKHGKRPLPFTAWELPFHAVDYCLAQAGVALADVDHVAYSFDPRQFASEAMLASETVTLPLQPSAHALPAGANAWDNPWDPLFAAYVLNAPRQLAAGAPHHLKRRFAGVEAEALQKRWHFVDHHCCHQASAFLAAPFERCAVMTLDGRGERATTTYGRYTGDAYRSLGAVHMPHSLGLMYEQVTSHLGFLHSSDEYKVMALAAMGTPRKAGELSRRVRVGRDGQYTVAPLDLEAWSGPPRERGAPLLEHHFDLAASLQAVLEDTVRQLAAWLREASGERRLAMAGGVALNCVMNARLRDSGIFDAVWVQPAAGDAGTALGAALWVDARERARRAGPRSAALGTVEAAAAPREDPARHIPALERAVPAATGARAAAEGEGGTLAPRRWTMEHAYLGPGFDDVAIEPLLRWAKLPYRRLDDVAEETAELLAQDRIIGWFQGRMEFGPRALGARSILASPIDPAMQQRLNELKDREDFRPVAPAVLHEAFADWFEPAEANGGRSPFMLFVYEVRAGRRERIPSACHTDGSARVQTVHADANPRFHALLQAFGRRTGVPVLVNTSFNVRGEPIVGTPKAAIEAFFSTPLDALVIGSFLVLKEPRA